MTPRDDLAGPIRMSSGPSCERPRAAVIGAGFGGLAAAIRLGARGYRVTVIDRLEMPGGRATAIRQDGYRFDLGPTIVTAPHLFEELWDLAGGRLRDDVRLVPLDPFYEIRFDDGTRFRAFADDTRARQEVARIAPHDLGGYDRFMEESAEIFELGFERLGREPFGSVAAMVRALPGLIRLRADRSVHAHVAGRVSSPHLRAALSFHPLFIGGDPFRVTSVYSLIAYLERRWGVHACIGGCAALADGLASLIRRQGGELLLGQTVAGITAEHGRATGVQLQNGRRIRADVTVSNADVSHTYGSLLQKESRRRWSDRRLGRVKSSMSLFVWHFGTQGTRGLWPEIGHHTILMGPRYRGLIRDIFGGRLADDMSLYLHRPAVTDPSAAPDGCDSFYALSPVPHLGGAVDWRSKAKPYRAAILERLEETVLPDVGRHIVTELVMTPLDFRDRYLSPLGAGFSIEPRLTQSAWFRPHNRSEELRDLYIVGAGTHPGAGLPGVVTSAAILDKVVPDVPVQT